MENYIKNEESENKEGFYDLPLDTLIKFFNQYQIKPKNLNKHIKSKCIDIFIEIDHLDYYIGVEERLLSKNKEELVKIKKTKNNKAIIKDLKEEIDWREDNLYAYRKHKKDLEKKLKSTIKSKEV